MRIPSVGNQPGLAPVTKMLTLTRFMAVLLESTTFIVKSAIETL